ncbi:Ig-like domain-containing protein, partial [Nocardioides sp.]|uniref:Ig-like domain-containing protein n=1 Tax=Nocardioides sp. TaxID=35761 RepID=UPI0039E31F9C
MPRSESPSTSRTRWVRAGLAALLSAALAGGSLGGGSLGALVGAAHADDADLPLFEPDVTDAVSSVCTLTGAASTITVTVARVLSSVPIQVISGETYPAQELTVSFELTSLNRGKWITAFGDGEATLGFSGLALVLEREGADDVTYDLGDVTVPASTPPSSGKWTTDSATVSVPAITVPTDGSGKPVSLSLPSTLTFAGSVTDEGVSTTVEGTCTASTAIATIPSTSSYDLPLDAPAEAPLGTVDYDCVITNELTATEVAVGSLAVSVTGDLPATARIGETLASAPVVVGIHSDIAAVSWATTGDTLSSRPQQLYEVSEAAVTAEVGGEAAGSVSLAGLRPSYDIQDGELTDWYVATELAGVTVPTTAAAGESLDLALPSEIAVVVEGTSVAGSGIASNLVRLTIECTAAEGAELTIAQIPVAKWATSSLATLASSSVPQGTAGSLAVSVTSESGTPSGTVSVTGSGVSQSATLTDGKATVALPATLAVGSHTFTVAYSGDATHEGSSASLTLTVTAAKVATTASL